MQTESKYVEDLKHLVMDEVFFVYAKIVNSSQIIAEWFELNSNCADKHWIKIDRYSLSEIWDMMNNRVRIDGQKI